MSACGHTAGSVLTGAMRPVGVLPALA